jgi:hypothetical protein
VAIPFGGAVQGVHEAAHVCGDVFDAHAVPQAW